MSIFWVLLFLVKFSIVKFYPEFTNYEIDLTIYIYMYINVMLVNIFMQDLSQINSLSKNMFWSIAASVAALLVLCWMYKMFTPSYMHIPPGIAWLHVWLYLCFSAEKFIILKLYNKESIIEPNCYWLKFQILITKS